MATKHLVLDPDVHEQLKARKRETGLTVKQIGNSALWAFLQPSSREQAALQLLIETGRITHEDYNQALLQAASEIQFRTPSIRDLGRLAPDRTVRSLAAGSWDGRELSRGPNGGWQIIEAWARDSRRELTPLHGYTGVQAYGVLLEGKMRLDCDGKITVLSAPQLLSFPPGHTCASAPLTRKTRILMVFIPAVWDHDGPESHPASCP